MKKFLLYLLLVILGVAILDVLSGMAMEYAYSNLPADSELRRSFKYTEDCDAELLVLGASRGVYDYNTVMLEDSLHMTCQSVAMEGMSVISQFITVKKAIAGGKTRIIIYDLASGQLSDNWVNNQMSTFYPFYWKNEDVRNVIDEQQGWKMRFLLRSGLLRNNSMLYDIIYVGYIRKSMDKNGFIALPYSGKVFKPSNKEPLSVDINPTGERYLQQIIDLCKSNSIRLILCDSPRLHHKKQTFDDYLEGIARKNQIEFWNYSAFAPVVTDLRYFKDELHINYRGAELFTANLIERLRSKKPEYSQR